MSCDYKKYLDDIKPAYDYAVIRRFGFGCVISLFCFFLFFDSALAQAQDSTGKESAAEESAVAQTDEKPEVKFSFDFRDPFRSWLPAKEEEMSQDFGQNFYEESFVQEDQFDASGLTVSGIVWGQVNPKAIINDTIYGVGDQINEATIIAIDKDGILLKYKSKEYLLKRGGSVSEKGGEL